MTPFLASAFDRVIKWFLVFCAVGFIFFFVLARLGLME